MGPDWEVAPTVVAEVWRVAFRQVVRIGESAKVGREVPWKCQRFGKTQGVQLVQPVSGDFLEIFRATDLKIARATRFECPLDLKIFWRATSFTRGSGACGVTVSLA